MDTTRYLKMGREASLGEHSWRKGKSIQKRVVWADEVGKELVKVGICDDGKELFPGQCVDRGRQRDGIEGHLRGERPSCQPRTDKVGRAGEKKQWRLSGGKVTLHTFGKESTYKPRSKVNAGHREGKTDMLHNSAKGWGRYIGVGGCSNSSQPR